MNNEIQDAVIAAIEAESELPGPSEITERISIFGPQVTMQFVVRLIKNDITERVKKVFENIESL